MGTAVQRFIRAISPIEPNQERLPAWPESLHDLSMEFEILGRGKQRGLTEALVHLCLLIIRALDGCCHGIYPPSLIEKPSCSTPSTA
jgi:hypothetical protein